MTDATPLDALPAGKTCPEDGAWMLVAPGCKCGCKGQPFCPLCNVRGMHQESSREG